MREDTVSALLRSLPEHMGAPAVLQYFDGAVRQRRAASHLILCTTLLTHAPGKRLIVRVLRCTAHRVALGRVDVCPRVLTCWLAVWQIGVEMTLRNKMVKLPHRDFEGILHPVFQEDEWKLIAVGGGLGVVIGLLQAYFIN